MCRVHKLCSGCFQSVFGPDSRIGCEKGIICRIAAAKRQECEKNNTNCGRILLETVENTGGSSALARSEQMLEHKQGEQKQKNQEKNRVNRINGEIYSQNRIKQIEAAETKLNKPPGKDLIPRIFL